MSVLLQHVRHRAYLLDEYRLRCVDCAVTLDIRVAFRTQRRRDLPPGAHDPDRCLEHPGQWRDHCGPCRSERLEATLAPPAQRDGEPMPADFREQVEQMRRSA